LHRYCKTWQQAAGSDNQLVEPPQFTLEVVSQNKVTICSFVWPFFGIGIGSAPAFLKPIAIQSPWL